MTPSPRVTKVRSQLATAAVFCLAVWASRADAATPVEPTAPEANAGVVVLESQSLRRHHVTIEIPRLEARGTPLTAGGLKDIIDPASPLTLAERLARLSATSITIPEIVVRPDPKAGEPPDQRVTLHDVLLADIQAGKAATVSVKSIDGHFFSRPDERDSVSVGAIVAHVVDPTLALTIATGMRTDSDLPISPIYKDISVAGITVKSGDDTTSSAQRLESDAFEGRPMLETPADFAALSDHAGEMESPEKSRFFAVLLDAATSFRPDRFQISGLSVEDRGHNPFTFKLRSVVVQGLYALKLAMLDVEGAAFEAKGAEVSFKSATLSNLDRGALFGAVMSRLMGLPPPAAGPLSGDGTAETEFKLDALHVAIPTIDTDSPFPLGSVNVIDVPSLETAEGVSKGGTSIENRAHVALRYDMPPGGSDANLQNLRDAGLSHLDLHFDYRIAYDTTTRELRLDEMTLDGKNLGAIALSGRVGDLPESPFSPTSTNDDIQKKLGKATFRDLKATVIDRGIIGSALPVIARTSGTAPALFKAGLKSQLDLQLPTLLGRTPAEAKVAAAIDSLLDAPGTMVLSFRSPHGVTFEDMANADDPSAIMRRLEVTAATRH